MGNIWGEVNLREMSPHPCLETLKVVTETVFNVLRLEHLSPMNFPCLSKITTDAKNIDLTTVTPNPNWTTLEVQPYTKVVFTEPLEMNFPNLEIVKLANKFCMN